MTILLWLLAAAFVVIGLIGVVVPALPGTALVFAGLLLAAWADDFARVGTTTLVVIAVLAAASYAIDVVAAAVGVKHLGASRRAVGGAALGMVAGLFFGLPGLILGPFAWAFLAELTTKRDLKQAGRAGAAAWIGIAIGIAAKVGLVFVMVGIFLGALFL